MKAIVFHGTRDVALGTVDDAVLEDPGHGGGERQHGQPGQVAPKARETAQRAPGRWKH